MCFKCKNKGKNASYRKPKGKFRTKKVAKNLKFFSLENYNIKPFQRTLERFQATYTHAYDNPFVKNRPKVLLQLPLKLDK